MRKAIYWLMVMLGVSLVCLLGGCKEKDDAVLKTITSKFDERDWAYDVVSDTIDNHGVYYVHTGFEGDRETVRIRIDVFPGRKFYTVIGHSDIKVDSLYRNAAILEMNDFNADAGVVSGYIDERGRIVFWLGRNTEGGAFSKEGFWTDMLMVGKEVDYETARICRKAKERFLAQ